MNQAGKHAKNSKEPRKKLCKKSSKERGTKVSMKGIKILVKEVCKEQEGTTRKDARKIRWVQAKEYSGKLARKYARVCKNINKELGKSILEKQPGTKQNVCKMSSREPGKNVCKVAKKQVTKLEKVARNRSKI